ncbi:MAG: exo-alpha-sialidase [Nitrosomonadales bacterium]|nr:exo-alpha-sialidase [Nitrosomonadales bacterium]
MSGAPLPGRLLVGCVILACFGAGFAKVSGQPAAAGFQAPPATAAHSGEPSFQSRFASSMLHTQTHAASAIELKDGRIRAFWFAGSREGARDVAIRSAVFDPAKGSWGAEQTVASRESTQLSLHRYISKLGNPVAGRAADGTLWLYYVTVTLGGWAGSSITALASRDEGETWSPPRRLITSPFLNISTLVKGAPFLYGDGSIGLPVYHEFIAKFGEIVRLDNSGVVLDKQRLSAGGGGALQPVVLVRNSGEALALMRYSGATAPRRVITVATRDGGRHWTAPEKSALANPNSALAAIALPDGRLLAVLNNQEAGRDALSLMVSADGGNHWKTVYQLEDQSAMRGQPPDEPAFLKAAAQLAREAGAQAADAGAYAESARRQVCAGQGCRYEFSYPCLIRAQSGDFHLVYTWNRSFIKHVTFTGAWLDQRMQAGSP